MSFLVTRPASPVPGMALISTLCSAAIFRTTGVDFRFRRSSAVSAAPLPPVASPTERPSAGGEAAAVTGAGRGAGDGNAVSPELRGGLDGAGARGAGGAPAGVAGLGGAGGGGGARRGRRLGGSGSARGRRRRRLLLRSRRPSLGLDPGDHRLHCDRLPFLHQNFGQDTGRRRRNLCVDLIG